MDAVQAWEMQQSRLGNKEKTIEQLRNSQARWAVAFDMIDADADGRINFEEACQALKKIMDSSSDIPRMKLKDMFQELDVLTAKTLDYRRFHKLMADISQYMTDTPNWRREEEDAKEAEEEEAEKRKQAQRREKQKKEASDVFAILGIQKSKDVMASESEKNQAVEQASEANKAKLRNAGQRIMETQKMVKRMGSLGALKKQITVSATPPRRDEPKRDVVSPSHLVGSMLVNRMGYGKEPIRRVTIDVATDLPDLHWRGYGAACFSLRFSPDNSQLAGAYLDGGLRIFDVDHAEHLHTVNVSPRTSDAGSSNAVVTAPPRLQSRGAAMMNLQWLPAARQASIIATVDTSGCVGFWEISKRQPPKIVAEMAGDSELAGLSFSNDGEKFLVGGAEKVVKVYDVNQMRNSTGKGVSESMSFGKSNLSSDRITGHRMKILSIRALPNQQELYVTGGLDRTLMVWDLREPRTPVGTIGGIEISGDSLDVAKNGMSLLVGNHRSINPLQLFDLRKLNEEQENKGCGPGRRPVQSIETAFRSYQWSGEESDEISKQTSLLFATAWDGDNNIIATAGEKENVARIFQRPAGGGGGPLTMISSVEGKSKAFYSAAVSSDARSAAFGSADGSVIISAVRAA